MTVQASSSTSHAGISVTLWPDPGVIFSNSRQFDARLVIVTSGLALAMGVLADLLFFRAGLGLNVGLWTTALVAGIVLTRRHLGLAASRVRLVCLGGSLLTAWMLTWRASDTLQGFNLLACATLLLLAMTLPARSGLRSVGTLRLVEAALVALFALIAGAVALGRMQAWQEHSSRLAAGNLVFYARGLLLALPLLLVFGALFVAADAVFEAQVARFGHVGVDSLMTHVLLIAVFTWLTAGLFWGFLAVEHDSRLQAELEDSWRLRTVETAIILGALVLLFAAFVLIQLRYLFGGNDVVIESVSLTYAQYARRGFFELVAVAALLLPVLLALDWAKARSSAASVAYRGLSAVLVALLLVIMVSALERLRIYEQAFGLTETRLYVAAALLWFGIVFAWFLATVLRGRRDDFAWGALVAAVVVLFAVNVLNPDGFIAARNADRLSEGKVFDAGHAASLSADAVPTLISNLDQLSPRDACTVASALLSSWSDADSDPRAWNVGRARAIETVSKHRTELVAACPR